MKPQLNWQDYQKLEFPTHQTTQARSYRSFKNYGLKAKLQDAWQRAVAYLSTSSEPHVWRSQDSTGQVIWNAYDPLTRRSIERVSMNEVRVWLEERYYQPL